ncbi:hypothetical protein CONPUDRAFT_138661 [Coniophora puteana RWD-64-598 SS2]|uniref:F-box domain-containing protein n=1 Tax=Coniophora puteana (strain RWD-64-598) TaxID=741705 RepID=A0A5M3MGJ0_CONPW|nr:uncharacterized protein CONPUDRAFT_138661 [Coniophora puteana RWD-64-598 SS2]EIW78349.1 hypothetical protein CONPUDRAFT_138661 [Coniophora puteana RWD-64-598 SS2]
MAENQNQSPIASLATETLCYIFELVNSETRWEIPLKPDNPRLFPFAQARVCRHWRDVLVTLPSIYWRKIIVPLDAPVLPSSVAAYVDASGNEERMEVHLLSHSATSEAEEEQPVLAPQAECQRVDTAMQHLAPHLARFNTLSIHTQYRSAALVAMKHISAIGNARMLCTLDIVSRVADTTTPASFAPGLTFPWLESIAIDTRSFIDWVHSKPKVGGGEDEEDEDDEFRDTPWLALKLTSYRPTSGLSGFTSTVLIDTIDAFAPKGKYNLYLEISDVAFDDEDAARAASGLRPRRSTTQPKPKKLDQLDAVKLTSLDYPFLKAFFDRYEPEQDYLGDGGRYRVILSKCSITGPLSIRVTPGLVLDRIETQEEILTALKAWSGAELEIIDCPAFDDAVINTLRTSKPVLGLCKELQYLFIVRCPDISAEALLKLFDERQMWLRKMHVYAAPRVLDECEEEGFRELVEDLSWTRTDFITS